MKCRFCGEETALINAHIIPAGFFRRLKQSNKPLVMVTNKAGEYTKKYPKGVYDKTIVCSKCELIWQEWDNYAQQLLTDIPLNSQVKYIDNKKICYIVEPYDYQKLKLFFISLIWRASVSSQPLYSKISLGRFEDVAKKYITNNDPGDRETFSVFLAKFDHPLAKPILDPHNDKYSDVNYLRFYLASYIAYIKVDNKPSPTPFSLITMDKNKPLYIICRNFQTSKELPLVLKLMSNFQQAKPSKD